MVSKSEIAYSGILAARIRFDILSSFDIVDLTFRIEGFVYEHF
jgi:hypothetical protein